MAWAPSYVTVEELRAYTRISDSADDASLSLAISAASRAIDQHTNRQFGVVASAEQRKYTARWDRRRCRWIVPTDDFMTISGLTVAVSAGTITDYVPEPINASVAGVPWTQLVVNTDSTVVPTSLEHDVTVTALWGWTTVPEPVQTATLLQASRIFSRRNSPYGIAGSPEQGSELRLLARLDVDVSVILGPYVRWWGAA